MPNTEAKGAQRIPTGKWPRSQREIRHFRGISRAKHTNETLISKTQGENVTTPKNKSQN